MRVAMLTAAGGPGRPEEWYAAAARCTDAVSVRVVPALTLPAEPGLPSTGRDPRRPHHYEVLAAARPAGTARRITAALRRENAECGRLELLHAHRPFGTSYVPAVARALTLPYVLSEHDPRWYAPATRRQLRRAARLYGDAAAVLPVSDSLLLRLGELQLPGRHRVLPVPLDETALPQVPARVRIGQDAVRIVAAGPLRAGRGWEELVDAFAAAHGKDPRLRLRILGDGPLAAALRLRADGAPVDLAADPGRPAVLHALAHADLCAYPRPVVGFGGTALDALACGTQVVGVRTGALPELVAHDGGVLVDAATPDRLADGLVEAAAGLPRHTPALLAERVRRAYGLPAAAARLAAVYAEASGRA